MYKYNKLDRAWNGRLVAETSKRVSVARFLNLLYGQIQLLWVPHFTKFIKLDICLIVRVALRLVSIRSALLLFRVVNRADRVGGLGCAIWQVSVATCE